LYDNQGPFANFPRLSRLRKHHGPSKSDLGRQSPSGRGGIPAFWRG
jgi:hypothetical protein